MAKNAANDIKRSPIKTLGDVTRAVRNGSLAVDADAQVSVTTQRVAGKTYYAVFVELKTGAVLVKMLTGKMSAIYYAKKVRAALAAETMEQQPGRPRHFRPIDAALSRHVRDFFALNDAGGIVHRRGMTGRKRGDVVKLVHSFGADYLRVNTAYLDVSEVKALLQGGAR